jgi:hypothetical protein
VLCCAAIAGVISASDFIHILKRLRISVSSGANPMNEVEMDAHTIRCPPTRLPACLPGCLHGGLPSWRPACLPARLPACLPARLPACQPAFMLACVPARSPASTVGVHQWCHSNAVCARGGWRLKAMQAQVPEQQVAGASCGCTRLARLQPELHTAAARACMELQCRSPWHGAAATWIDGAPPMARKV